MWYILLMKYTKLRMLQRLQTSSRDVKYDYHV